MLEKGALHIVHLVDSPGHVDFSGEVEAALRICDGAIVVVDVVEGVCVQTESVLRAALEHAVEPVLVLNKLDRLFQELHLSPMEAYRRIQMVIEQVNVIMGVREVEQMMEEATLQDGGWTPDADDEGGTESGYFSPELGNVVFASAMHGWAFRIDDFAKIFAKRFGLSERALQRTLWGDSYQLKGKRIIRRKSSSTKGDPMFPKFVLSAIHQVYDAVLSTVNDLELAVEKRSKIVAKLALNVSKRDLRHRDPKVVLSALMSAWLPAAKPLIEMIVHKLPSAKVAQMNRKRLAVVWPHDDDVRGAVHRKEAFARLYRGLSGCTAGEGAPVFAVVTKMIQGPVANGGGRKISQPGSRESASEAREKKEEVQTVEVGKTEREMIAFARVLSGTISVGSKLYAYGPRYRVAPDGTYDKSTVAEVTVSNLYLLMGRNVDPLNAVSAGSIAGIGGLEDSVVKTATLSSEPPGLCLPAQLAHASAGLLRDPVVHVAVEPHLPNQLAALKIGLRKLNQADPSVETKVTDRGEYMVSASGELHLERCLKDLREIYAKGIRIHVSQPLVSFRETVVGGSSLYIEADTVANEQGGEEGRADEYCKAGEEKTAGARHFLENSFISLGKVVNVSTTEFSFSVYAAPIPMHLAKALDDAGATVRAIAQAETLDESRCNAVRTDLMDALRKDAKAMNSSSSKVSEAEFETVWREQILPLVWSCGPKRFGANLLIGPHVSAGVPKYLQHIFRDDPTVVPATTTSEDRRKREVQNGLAAGFQYGVQSGPLTDEPMHGVAILVDSLSQGDAISSGGSEEGEKTGKSINVSGLAMGQMKEATRRAVLRGNARIMEGVLRADISVTSEALGGTYTAIGKRRGRVLGEEAQETMNIFGIQALIPVVESFGFAGVLRKKTSGVAAPNLYFSHWETVETDPFWEAKTEEDLEELGAEDSTAENNNLARKLMNGVRRRKGLKIEEKIVEKAEKQRTLSRKK